MIKMVQSLLEEVIEEAKASPRKRKNYNFHTDLKDPIQRMLNALEPDTYLPPHRHLNPGKDEIFLVLRGSLILVEFTDEGEIADSLYINPLKGIYGGEIAAGKWHTLIVLESGTVIYEVKQGPFSPITTDNLAPWAPHPDETKQAIAYLDSLKSRLV